jgi:signal transduction histidine kinase
MEQTGEPPEEVAGERAAAAAGERTRIARELHDVVAHSISVMVVQTAGVRRLLREDQERERDALLSVELTGRDALSEMRRLLGLMRPGEHDLPGLTPQPGLKHLDRLVADAEAAGLAVALSVEGDPVELPPGIDLSAYRIVQLALARSHGARATVIVRYGSDRLALEVADDGTGVNGSALDDLALVGMRERIALYDGTLEVGPRDGGGFVLRAELPVGERG